MELHNHAEDSWVFPDDNGVWLKSLRLNSLELFQSCNAMMVHATPPEKNSSSNSYNANDDYYALMDSATVKSRAIMEWVYNLIEMGTDSLMGREIRSMEDNAVDIRLLLNEATQAYRQEENRAVNEARPTGFRIPSDQLVDHTKETLARVSNAFRDHTRYGCDRTDYFNNV